jgi:hypothetical protein
MSAFRNRAPGHITRLLRGATEAVIRHDLRSTFRRVVWAGPGEPFLPPGPVVVYANHHFVHDSYLLWLLAVRTLGRQALVWMEDWKRVPVFAPLGALPFPSADAAARMRTIRETSRRMTRDPQTVLFLYPEGRLGPPDAGLAPFRTEMGRLARVLPEDTTWVPAAVHVTWWGEARPTAVLATGVPHADADGAEVDRIETLMASLRFVRPADVDAGSARVLLDGRRGADEWAELRWLAPIFSRWNRPR